jgi:hypothetical protein
MVSCLVVSVEATLIDGAIGDRNEEIRGGNGIIDLEKLATAFHDCMTEDQSFRRAGQYRRDFFQKVCERAEIVSFSVISVRSFPWLMKSL